MKAEWVSESIKAGSLLDYKDFLLYTNHSKLQPRLKFQSAESSSTKQCLSSDDKNNCILEDSIEDGRCNVTQNKTVTSQEKAKFYMDETVLLTTDTAIIPTDKILIETLEETEFPPNKTIEPLLHLGKAVLTHIKSVLPTNATVLSSDKVFSLTDKSVPRNKNIVVVPDVDKNPFARTANDPKFLSEYYNNSRLHHISQLGAGFKQYVNELRDSSDHSFPLRESLRSTSLKVSVKLICGFIFVFVQILGMHLVSSSCVPESKY